jgi:hypothetical protein
MNAPSRYHRLDTNRVKTRNGEGQSYAAQPLDEKHRALPLEAERGSRYENDVLLNSCAGNIAMHIAIIVQKNNNMTRGISTIPFHFFGRNDNASANGNMPTP